MATFRTSRGGSPAEPARPHLVLVGLPGAGKTAVGDAAAKRLGVPFLDFDREIEVREGRSVSAIFAERGEHAFRSLERALTAELATVGGMVLAPGGGWISNREGVELLRPPATIIYLRARPETVLRRMGAASVRRPLLAGPEPLATLQALLDLRREAYESADRAIDTDSLSLQQVIARVTELAPLTRAG